MKYKAPFRVLMPLVLVVTLCSSCAAALVGGAFYKSSKTREQKRVFLEDFHKNNIEREKAGLQALDLCTEKYQFDEDWAKEDTQCKKRIEKYEAGDTTALGTSLLNTNQKQETPQPVNQQPDTQ